MSYYRYEDEVPNGCGDGVPQGEQDRGHGRRRSTNTNATVSQMDTEPVAQQFWADPGATVKIASDEPITYIVSIVPGTVLAVKAYKQLTGERRLVDVPTDLYTVTTKTYGTVTAVQIVVNKPLSSITDQGWSDDLYVTFQSSVGPDIVDILKYLIENYTDLTWDDDVLRPRSGEARSRSRPTSRSWSGRTRSRCCRRSPSRPAAPSGSATACST